MPQTISFSLPPFRGMVRLLIVINIVVYFITLLLDLSGGGHGADPFFATFALVPKMVVHGKIWQLFTYSFLHGGVGHILFNMLGLWMFGTTLEEHWGGRRFLEFFFFCVLGAALVTVGLSYAGGSSFGLTPTIPTVGASGGIYGVLLAFGWFFGERLIFMFPLPFAMKAKYLVAILILVAVAGALSGPSGTAHLAHLGGMLFGYVYLKFLPGRGLGFAFSEGYFGMRNVYHRWQRQRAARKFQVYMRTHDDDPKRFFNDSEARKPEDEDRDKKDGGPGGWVN